MNELSMEYEMSTQTLVFRIVALLLGAVTNYAFLLFFSLVTRDSLIFLIFFSLTFVVFLNELVGQYKLFGLEIQRFRLYQGEVQRAQDRVTGAQVVLLPLFFCIGILLFQYNLPRP